ncbi:MAG: lysozyme inhibitor LprI family protein [Pseudomonadota bacterium]
MPYVAGLFLALSALSAFASDESPDCDNAMTTLEINQCAVIELDAAEADMHRYLDAALHRHEADTALVAAIQQSQARWQDYLEAHCDAVYSQWRESTIRGVMSLACQKALTRERTHTLWENFLVTMEGDSQLPEPAR